MGTKSALSADEIKRRYRIYTESGRNVTEAARRIGVERATLRASIQHYEAMKNDKESALEFPNFPKESLSVREKIERQKQNARLRRQSYEAHTWFPVKVKDDKPIGVIWFGDPHVDDDGCDWDTLDRHIELCKKPGVYGANIGDTINNWAGRLVRKYADQETSAKTAGEYAEWFMLDSGIRWLVFLLGNHDQWGDGATILNQMAKRYGTHKLVLHDWEARFRLVFPNKTEVRIWAAHDFPGFSQWHNLHGPIKSAKMGPEADLLVCGHKHCWAIHKEELPGRDLCPTLIRVRGYKFNDDYARRIGALEQQFGSAILTIFNPHSAAIVDRITPFTDLEAGVDYLQWMRKRV